MIHKRIIHHVHNHILPTKHNEFIPHILRANYVWAMLGVGFGLFLFSQITHTTGYFNIAAEVYPSVIVDLTNKDRASNGLSPLSENQTLVAAAKLKADDMATSGYFAHTSPTGITPWHWFTQAGYNFIYAGENLAVNFDETPDVENAWLNSPTHRKNIMNPSFTEMGVATTQGYYKGSPTTFVVELFGTPAIVKSTPPPAPVPQKTISTTPAKKPVAASAPTPKSANPIVAGESTEAVPLVPIQETNDSISVKNTDPALVEQLVVTVPPAHIPWYDRIILNSDTWIAIILETVVVLLIIATGGMVTREYEKHHIKHMIYGIFLTVIFTSFLFVGRMGVFAAERPVQPLASYIENN